MASRVQVFFTALPAKLLALAAIVIGGIVRLTQGRTTVLALIAIGMRMGAFGTFTSDITVCQELVKFFVVILLIGSFL